MADHFDNVKSKMRHSSSGDEWEDVDPPVQNEFTRDLKKGK